MIENYEIDENRLRDAVKEAARSLDGKDIPNLYAFLALAELAGRIIATCANNKLELDNMRSIAKNHLDRTALIGGMVMKNIAEVKEEESLIIKPTYS